MDQPVRVINLITKNILEKFQHIFLDQPVRVNKPHHKESIRKSIRKFATRPHGPTYLDGRGMFLRGMFHYKNRGVNH